LPELFGAAEGASLQAGVPALRLLPELRGLLLKAGASSQNSDFLLKGAFFGVQGESFGVKMVTIP
jgi:hypothetical protein